MSRIEKEKRTSVALKLEEKRLFILLDLNNSCTIELELPKSIERAKFSFEVRKITNKGE